MWLGDSMRGGSGDAREARRIIKETRQLRGYWNLQCPELGREIQTRLFLVVM
jgi:hypothetical protein